MFRLDEQENQIVFKFSAEMKLIDRLIKELKEVFPGFGDESSFSPLRLLMREMLINAVEHGCHKNPGLCVSGLVRRIADMRYLVTVEDEGDGFDYKSLNFRLSGDSTQFRSRGFPLINALSDGIEFNEKGNSVTVYITLQESTNFSVQEEGGTVKVVSSGSITASSSDKFREVLLDLLNKGYRKISFDMEKVEDIDSVGLSSFIILARNIMEKHGKDSSLEIFNASEDVKRLFEMTMLDKLFKISAKEASV